jgi:hypothetical protein
MGRGTTRRPKPKQRGGPSLFFLIALAIGIVILAWVAINAIRKPAFRTGANVTAGRAAPLHS